MSTSTRKIVAGLLSIAMVLTLVVGLSATTASAQSVAFSRNLTVGATGADVTALQTWLASKGFFSVTPTGYFGSITRRAVAQYQASVGITPAVGYFGPITRASVGGYNGGNTGGNNGAGCPAGAVYNYMTGALCGNTGGSTQVGNVEGTLEVTLAGTPANNANVTSSTDVNGSNAENPGNFINTIKAWDGSTLVKSWSVGTSDFVKDSSNVYYIRLSNLGLTVPKDTQKNLVFSVTTNGGIDNNRVVVLTGYGTNSLLTTSGNNVVSYYNISGGSFTRTHTFVKPGDATLTLTGDASNPVSQTYRIDPTSGAQGVTLETFAVRANTGDVRVTSVAVTTNGSASAGSTLFLYDGSTLIDSRTAPTATSTATTTFSFSNSPISVSKDQTKTFTIKADYPTGTINGSVASSTVTAVSYDKPNGSSATVTGAIAGNNHTFFGNVSQITASTPMTATAVTVGTGTSTTRLTATMTFKVKPIGGSQTQPTSASFVVKVGTTTTALTTVPAGQVGVRVLLNGSVIPASQSLSEGVEYTIELSPVIENSSLTFNGQYAFYVTSYAWTVGSQSTTQTTGLDTLQTNSVYFGK
jgi:peptidoglycan hydrolase-like protein with peptidoglycan-binding domain